MDFHDGTLDLAYYDGTGHLFLNEPLPAEGFLQRSFDRLPENRIKARAILLLGLAMAAAQRLQFDQAAVRATEAVVLALDQPIMPIMPIWQRAQDVRAVLDAASGSAEVRALDDQRSLFGAALGRTAPKALS